MEHTLQFLAQHWMELLSAILGIIYMIQQSKTSAWMWATGTVMPLIKLFVDFDSGLYADFGMQLYYIIIAVYGFLMWRRKRCVVDTEGSHQVASLPVTNMPRRYWLPVMGVLVGCWLLMAYLLTLTDSDVVWIDSLNTALCIIGMWTCARKYIENWWFWITYDLICVPLYLYKELYFWAIMAVVYIILGIYGWLKWRRLMAE
ncbi:MAG: nicotinamide mononucleotide transporter [Prevotellaceae bacterium]|nr:nicotinamide mononucleotide transporter [Candidatus Colivivens caballi]